MKNRGIRIRILFSIITFLIPSLSLGEGGNKNEILSVETIVNKANHAAYYQGKDGRAKVSMRIIDGQGRERKRKFTILRRDDNEPGDRFGDQQFYIYFHRPADVNKTVFMVWKHVDRDDDRWLYLPALDLVKRIAASDERTSFVGSDFFYEDVSGRGVDEDTHELVETTKNYFVLKSLPKNPKTVEFASYTAWVHRKTFLPVKIEYFDRSGKKYRVYEALRVEEKGGYPTVIQARIKNLLTQGETTVTYTDMKYDIGLPKDIFTERYLRNPPKRYLR